MVDSSRVQDSHRRLCFEETLLPIAVDYSGRRWRHTKSAPRGVRPSECLRTWPPSSTQPSNAASARLEAIDTARISQPIRTEVRRRDIRTTGVDCGLLVQPGLSRTAPCTERMLPPAWPDESPTKTARPPDRTAALIEAVIRGTSIAGPPARCCRTMPRRALARSDPSIVTFAVEKTHRRLRTGMPASGRAARARLPARLAPGRRRYQQASREALIGQTAAEEDRVRCLQPRPGAAPGHSISSSSGTPRFKALAGCARSRAAFRSIATALRLASARSQSIATLPAPAPMSQSSSPGNGARLARVMARISCFP